MFKKFLSFLRKFQKAELSVEEKVLKKLKRGNHYELAIIWEPSTLANLEKLDRLLLLLLKILRHEGVQIDALPKSDLAKSLSSLLEELISEVTKLTGESASLLQDSRTAQMMEIEKLNPKEWFGEFRMEIDHLNEKLQKILKLLERQEYLPLTTRRAFLRLSTMAAACMALNLAGCDKPPNEMVPDIPPQVYREGQTYSVYFDTASWELTTDSMKGLLEFFKTRKLQEMFVEGYCDERGSIEYNWRLGNQRAEAVKSFSGYAVPFITTISYGENRPAATGHTKEAYKKNRRAVIVYGTNVIWRALDVNKANAYLIDGSGTMRATLDNLILHEEPLAGNLKVRNDSRWGFIAVYPFPKNSEVYAFSTDKARRPLVGRIASLRSYFPHGETPIWESIIRLVKAKKHQTITVLTDGDNNIGSATKDDVIREARAAKTAINMIGIGVFSEKSESDMVEVAARTGGSHYIILSMPRYHPNLNLVPWQEH